MAEAAHAGQKRKSGDPYITHPLAVATVLAGLGMDTTTLVAALLHDTVEDTGVTLDTITADFGSEVTHLVDGVTKIDKVKLGDAAQAETIRKMIVAMARDPRVLVIKLADRLHNMRTLRFLPPEKQEKKARETLEILAPLAHRLGMNTIKWELEDLAFATLYPKRYDEIVRLVAERAPSRDTYLAEVTSTVNEQLKTAKIEAVVTGRPKHYYSIYQKMIVRGRDFTDIWDLVGIRILVDSVRDCYAALGIMHAHWQPVPGPLQGLRRDAEVQHVPVAAHDGDRPAGQAGRAADPHARHAPHRRVRHRRALEVQGEGAGRRQAERRRVRRAQGRLARRHAVAAPAAGLAARGPGARRVPRDAALRPRSAGGLRLHAQGRRDQPARRVDAGRLRLRGAHRGRLPHASAPGSTARWSRWTASCPTATSSRSSPPGRRRPAPSQDWLAFVGSLAGAHQDPAVVHQGAPRGRGRGRQGGADPGDAQGRACRCSGCSAARR